MQIAEHQREGVDGNPMTCGKPPIEQTPVSMRPPALAIRLAVVSHADAGRRMKAIRIQATGTLFAPILAYEFRSADASLHAAPRARYTPCGCIACRRRASYESHSDTGDGYPVRADPRLRIPICRRQSPCGPPRSLYALRLYRMQTQGVV